ncbi:MAG: nitroreductase family protein [Heliobacteriaceae bacterium]|nr:nitroreductase family protein [Heliobacteriaceae bacterium]
MDLTQIIQGRRSIRKYKPEEPPFAVIEKIITAGLWAPSNMNQQPWHFVVVRGEKRKALLPVLSRTGQALLPKLQKNFAAKPKVIAFTLKFFEEMGQAPILIFCYGPGEFTLPPPDLNPAELRTFHLNRTTVLQSVSAAIQNLLLAAHAADLGTCWLTAPLYLAEEINHVLGITGRDLVAVVTLGYPDQSPPAPPRRPDRVTWLGFD